MLLRDTIFLVDASPVNRAALRNIFEGRFNILEAGSLPQAEFLFQHNRKYIAAILMNLRLIDQSISASLHQMEGVADLSLVPLIAIVDTNDVQNEHRAFQLGATDVIFHPFHAVTTEQRVCNLIELYRNKWTLEELVKEQSMALRHTNEIMVDTLSSIIEHRSVESGQHILRIRNFTKILLEDVAFCCPEYGLTERAIESISSAAALHDIGKISIPDAILNKPGKLTAEEFEVMKSHTTAGSNILAQLGNLGDEEYLRYAYNICRYHHERWDGRGYPEGLAGNSIPICAQVVGLADAYDALTSERVYKAAYPRKKAANMILNGECGEFSPKLLECFKHVRSAFAKLSATYADGHSPKSDSITTPLAPPSPAATSTLHTLLAKHTAVLQYLDAPVVEINLDEGGYHLIHNPDPNFTLISEAATLEDAISKWSEYFYSLDGDPLPPNFFRQALEDFFASGLRRRIFHNLLRAEDGQKHPYNVTLLRAGPENSARDAIIIWQRAPLTPGERTDAAAQEMSQALDSLLSISQSCLYDRWLTMDHVSQDLVSLLGYTEEELRDRFHNRLMELVLPERQESIRALISDQFSRGSTCEVEFPFVKKDGQIVWTLGKGSLSTKQGDVEHIYGILVDITETKNAQNELRLALAQQQLIMNQSNDIVFEIDFVADRLTCSPKWVERFGYEPLSEQISIRIPQASHFHPDDIALWQEKFAQLKSGTRFVEFSVRVATANGHYLWTRVRATSLLDDVGVPIKAVGVFIDIDSELRASQSALDSINQDPLTKLLNKEATRRKIEAMLTDIPEHAISALAIIDLDNFKQINDRFGHLFGDTVLTHVSGEISRFFRGTDVVGRIGGDEFLVFVSNIPDRQLVEGRLLSLVDAIQNIYASQNPPVPLSCSVGLAFSPEHGLAYQELFQHADRALYQAKDQGKNQLCCFSSSSSRRIAPSMVSKQIDSDHQPGLANNSLVQYVFEELYESGDLERTIQSLMSLVGQQMDVSRVYIFENNSDNTACSNTFEWCNKGISPEIDNLQNVSYVTDIPGYDQIFNERGLFYCPDVTTLPQHIRDILEPQGIKSILQCAIRDQGVFRGYVGFDENNDNRLWTQEQIDLLTFLSHILSAFLLKQRVQNQTNTLVKDLRNVLDSQYTWTYVIDPDTFQLRFLNGKTQALATKAQVGKLCYKTLMGLDSPCENCPARIGDGSGGSCIIENHYLKVRVRATAHKIHWDNKKSWLITCQEMPD